MKKLSISDLKNIDRNYITVDNVVHVNGVTFKMIKVSGGTFNGITLSDYWIGETAVTQELWQAVMGSNPSFFTGNLQRPVEQVSWNDIVNDFLPALNEVVIGWDGRTFALPTEAQWEFAARGGNQSHGYRYAGSDNIDDVAWYYDNSGGTSHPVKGKQPNELGLYDMCGNVWEWCENNYEDFNYEDFRVLRGGSWISCANFCRVSSWFNNYPDYRYHYFGFRLVLVP